MASDRSQCNITISNRRSCYQSWQVLLDGTIGAVSGLLAATGIGMWGAAIVSGGLGFAGSVGGDLIESNGDWSSVNWKKAVVLGIVNFGLGAWAGAGSQNSTALGKGLLKNKEVHKTPTLYNATNNCKQASFQNVVSLVCLIYMLENL